MPIELTDVLCRPLTDADLAVPAAAVTISSVGPADGGSWAVAAADGWSEHPEVVPFVLELGAVYPRTSGATCFAAAIGEAIAATGVIAMHTTEWPCSLARAPRRRSGAAARRRPS